MKSEFLGGANMRYNDNMKLGHLEKQVSFLVLRKEHEHGK